jgi:hypothetical protein
MSNSIFDFLNFDLNDLVKKLDDFKVLANDTYNDVKNNVKKYDLDTEEGYEAFIKEAANIRTELLRSNSIFSDKLINLLDSAVERAMKKHSEKMANKNLSKVKENKVNDLVDAEVNRSKNENHKKINTGKGVTENVNEDEDEIDWPSDKLTFKQKKNITKLVDEYMNTMILPYINDDIDEDMVHDMASGLFEFAAWILTKEED